MVTDARALTRRSISWSLASFGFLVASYLVMLLNQQRLSVWMFVVLAFFVPLVVGACSAVYSLFLARKAGRTGGEQGRGGIGGMVENAGRMMVVAVSFAAVVAAAVGLIMAVFIVAG